MRPSTLCCSAAWLCRLALFFGLFASGHLHAQTKVGYIQVTCEPGVQVFLDGVFKGVTMADQRGLILASVPAGRHQLRFVKEGHHLQVATVVVGSVEVLAYRVQPFTRKEQGEPRGSGAEPQELETAPQVVSSTPVAESSTPLSVSSPPEIANSAPAIESSSARNRSISDLGLKLIWIAPGSFVLGSAQGGESDERPVTQVTITRGFWLGQTEITQAQWRAIIGSNPARFQGDEQPVETVNWYEAMEFCRKLTQHESVAGRLPQGYAYTLPTEAQWEYACRAGTTGDYAGDLNAMAWYIANSGNTTRPVGQKQANAWGLYDMHGNVWEWCLDWYGSYSGGSVTDAKGDRPSTHRVIRGGSWNNSANYCRSALRLRDEPEYRRNYLGFRLALSPVP